MSKKPTLHLVDSDEPFSLQDYHIDGYPLPPDSPRRNLKPGARATVMVTRHGMEDYPLLVEIVEATLVDYTVVVVDGPDWLPTGRRLPVTPTQIAVVR